MAIPVLDTFIAEMEFRFEELNQRVTTLLTLIPPIITKPDSHGETMADLIGLYRNDLPNPDIVDQELLLCKNKWYSISAESRFFYTYRICKEVQWKEILKCVWALEVRVHIASNILRVQMKFLSSEEITKLGKKKYENRPINFSRTNVPSLWYCRRLWWSPKVVFSASPQENK